MLPYYQLVSIPEVGVIFLQILARTFWIFISRHFYSTAAFKWKWSETQPSIFRSYFIQFDQNHIATQKYNQIDVKLKPNPVSIRKNMRWRVVFTQFVVQNCTFYPHGIHRFYSLFCGLHISLKGNENILSSLRGMKIDTTFFGCLFTVTSFTIVQYSRRYVDKFDSNLKLFDGNFRISDKCSSSPLGCIIL